MAEGKLVTFGFSEVNDCAMWIFIGLKGLFYVFYDLELDEAVGGAWDY